MSGKVFAGILMVLLAASIYGEEASYLRDRGEGISTSMFGTYIKKGELLIYPFFEYYQDHNYQYQPDEFGYANDIELRGSYEASEGLIFLGYGLSERLVVELEAAIIHAELETSPADPTLIADEISESGLGDVQTQFNWRWRKETAAKPEIYSFLEVVYPFNKDKDLTGTSDYELKLGSGLVRGFKWGTMDIWASVEYPFVENRASFGAIGIQYLKRLSPSWKLFIGTEANQDEVEFITETQWYVSQNVRFKFNNAFGLTSKATDWAPEVGVMFSIPTK
ncbi:MAG: hypothetical protein ACREBV_00160 [Candidatus Zixiibacteriota bacterium]